MTATAVLVAYAAAIALLAPQLLRGAWMHRAPRLALLLWHTAAVSVVLALMLTGVTCAMPSVLVRLGLAAADSRNDIAGVAGVGLALLGPVVIVARIVWVLVRLVAAQRLERARHLEVLDMVGPPRL